MFLGNWLCQYGGRIHDSEECWCHPRWWRWRQSLKCCIFAPLFAQADFIAFIRHESFRSCSYSYYFAGKQRSRHCYSLQFSPSLKLLYMLCMLVLSVLVHTLLRLAIWTPLMSTGKCISMLKVKYFYRISYEFDVICLHHICNAMNLYMKYILIAVLFCWIQGVLCSGILCTVSWPNNSIPPGLL